MNKQQNDTLDLTPEDPAFDRLLGDAISVMVSPERFGLRDRKPGGGSFGRGIVILNLGKFGTIRLDVAAIRYLPDDENLLADDEEE